MSDDFAVSLNFCTFGLKTIIMEAYAISIDFRIC